MRSANHAERCEHRQQINAKLRTLTERWSCIAAGLWDLCLLDSIRSPAAGEASWRRWARRWPASNKVRRSLLSSPSSTGNLRMVRVGSGSFGMPLDPDIRAYRIGGRRSHRTDSRFRGKRRTAGPDAVFVVPRAQLASISTVRRLGAPRLSVILPIYLPYNGAAFLAIRRGRATDHDRCGSRWRHQTEWKDQSSRKPHLLVISYFAAAIEIAQNWIPGRHQRTSDFWVTRRQDLDYATRFRS